MLKSKKNIKVDREQYELLQEFAKDASVSLTVFMDYMREFGVKKDGKLILDIAELVQVVDLLSAKLDDDKYKNFDF